MIRFRTISGEMVEVKGVTVSGITAQHVVRDALHAAWLAFPQIARPLLEMWAGRMRR